MKNIRFYFAALLLAFVSTMSAQRPQITNSLEVEVLIFSGRPNPVFTVTDPAEISEIMGLVSGLPAPAVGVAKSAEGPAALGYRGIEVRNRSKVGPEVQSFTTRRSTVQIVRGADARAQTSGAGSVAAQPAPETRADNSSQLERRLLTLAQNRGVIDSALLAHINSAK